MLWQFADLPLTTDELDRLNAVQGVAEKVAGLLTNSEIAAMEERIANLLQAGKFPLPPTDWPAIPWPPF